MTRRVLFVCLGNICRSPTAEGVFRQMASEAGLAVDVDSCGTGGWHVGHPPHAPAIRAAAGRGYDLSALRARQASTDDFAAFDLILAMDRDNLAALERMRPAGNATPVRLFLDGMSGTDEVPDPYYEGGFDRVLDLIEAGSRRLIAQLQ